MANSYFRFKEFTIHQDGCAMKVCTDSCLFGAWSAHWLLHNKPGIHNILDIGAGTGLLSLMLAQKLPDIFTDTVEIDELCYRQACRNISSSEWMNRIAVFNDDINHFNSSKKYDVIISNPPFYESDLASHDHAKNTAHHSKSLTLKNLLTAVKKLLSEDGCCFVLLPYRRLPEFEKLASEEDFFVNKRTMVKQTNKHPFFRVMYRLSGKRMEITEDEIIIRENNSYTPEFMFLLKDYYLHL